MTENIREVFTLKLTRGEVNALHEQIGDVPKAHVGPKLLELYKRLDAIVGVDWPGTDTEKARKR